MVEPAGRYLPGWPALDWLHEADRQRRRQGRLLARLGYGPLPTPSRMAFHLMGLRLNAYGKAAPGLAVLLVPAPIKRAYIWDLLPEASVVRRCLARDFRVYLLEWEEHAEAFGLADYADRLIGACLEAIERETGRSPIVLVGHSLGGTLAAIFAALHPERLRGLVLLEAPTHFGADAGVSGSLSAALPPPAGQYMPRTIPGTALDFLGMAASPWSFVGARWLDLLAIAGDGRRLAMHWRVERWALDELAMPARLFTEVIQHLYREDRFLGRRLMINGRLASPDALAMPILAVMRPESLIIPPAAILPLLAAAPSRDKRVIPYHGDRGVALQHVGILVGETAHREIWPVLLEWIALPVHPSPR